MYGKIFTDGSCLNNPGPGGWSCIFCDNNEKIIAEIFGSEIKTTNNRMELTSVIRAISVLEPHSDVKIFSDSKYVVDGITKWIKNWFRKGRLHVGSDLKNVDLWIKLFNLVYEDCKDNNIDIEWIWVKGHSISIGNNRADEAAINAARTQCKTKILKYK